MNGWKNRSSIKTPAPLLSLSLALLVYAGTAFAQTDVNVNGTVASRVHSANSSLEVDRTSLPADGATAVVITATIVDVAFDPLPGRTVQISSSRGSTLDLIRCYNGPILTLNNFANTDSNGRVVCVASSTTPGQATFSAVTEGVELDDKPVVSFQEVIGAPPPPPPPPVDEPPPGVDEPPPGVVEPSPTEPQPSPPAPTLPKPPSVFQKIVDRVGQVLDQIPSIVPGGLGIAALIPTVVFIVPLGSSISASVMAGIPALQYLLFSAFPAFRSPRRWGTVRDATTNVPVPGIFVDLVDAANARRVRRVMTDRTGRFGFLAPAAGQYWVEVKSPLYQHFQSETFDSAALRDKAISFDILLAPIESARVAALQKTVRYMRFLAFVQIVQFTLLIGGSLLSVGLFINEQSMENVLLISIYALLWVLHFISSMSYTQSGHIMEHQTDNAVNEAVVQVTSTKRGEQQFVHSTISDESGRFLILVPPGQYTVISAKTGYNPNEKVVSGEIQNIEMNMERTDLDPNLSQPEASPSTSTP